MTGFQPLDWLVLVAYGVVLLVTGWMFNRKAAGDTEGFFLGGRKMPVWAVTISVIATALSAATFVGGPQQAYAGNLTYLASNIGGIIAALLVAVLLIPRMYRLGVATPYGLLEARYGRAGRQASAIAFLLGRVMASGARVYMVGIPAALIIFGQPEETQALIPVWQIAAAILAITLVGIAYTLAGGVKSVIWTDVIQMGVFIAAILGAIFVLMNRIPGGIDVVWDTLANAQAPDKTSKLTLFDFSTDLTRPYTIISCCVGFVLLGLASYGMDQDMVQRMLTCKNAAKGSASVIAATIMTVPVVALFMIVGLLLYIFYQRPDVMGNAAPGSQVFDSTRVFLSFILEEMPAGISGLMMAGLFAAGLSSLNSGLNSMSSTVVNDLYREWRSDRSDKHYLAMGRAWVVIWGVVLGTFACICIVWQRSDGQTLIDFALGVMTFAYAGLIGVFLTAMLTSRGSALSAIVSLLTGFLIIFAMNKPAIGLVLSFFEKPIEAGYPVINPSILTIDWIEQSADQSLPLALWSGVWDYAFAWKLTIAAGVSTVICMLGSPDLRQDGAK